jgi:hypothetical protein
MIEGCRKNSRTTSCPGLAIGSLTAEAAPLAERATFDHGWGRDLAAGSAEMPRLSRRKPLERFSLNGAHDAGGNP